MRRMRRLSLSVLLSAAAAAADPGAEIVDGDEIVAVVSANVPGFSESAESREAFHDEEFKMNLARRLRDRRRHEVITRRDLARETWGLLAGAAEPASPLEAAERRREAERQALQMLIDQKVLARAAVEQGFDISDREVDDEILGRLRRNPKWGVRDLADFARRLAEDGDTLERYRREVREGLLSSYYEQYNIRSVEVSPARLAAYHAEHAADFSRPAGVRLTRILVDLGEGDEARAKAAARAAECLARLRAGGDTGDAAREFSDDLETREAGGACGFVDKGSYPGAVEEVAYACEPGVWQGPVEAKGFLWILRVDERRDASVMTLAEAQKRVRELVLREERRNRREELLARARKGVYVWMSPALAPAEE